MGNVERGSVIRLPSSTRSHFYTFLVLAAFGDGFSRSALSLLLQDYPSPLASKLAV
jgi:hypothetical protein